MKISHQLLTFIVALVFLRAYDFTDFCGNPNLELFDDDMYMSKDIDMCMMFMQSYVDSIDMNITVKDYLLKYLPYSYVYNGHLHSFTQYQNNYTFLLASAINQNENHLEKNTSKSQMNDTINHNQKQLNYISINWEQSSYEIYDTICKRFQIDGDCNSRPTLYVTFPSYPENNLLLNFFQNFQNKLEIPLNDANNLQYRYDVDPSFLSIIDVLPLVIFQEILQHHPFVRIVFCGHGLGGTMAQLSTLHTLSKQSDSHPTQLRSITVGALFFARKTTVDYIQNRHLEKHFINIYHEMDVIPFLFNMAGLLSQSVSMMEQGKIVTAKEDLWTSVTNFFVSGKNKTPLHQSHLKNLLAWLCHSLTANYASISSKICEPTVIGTALDLFKKSLSFIENFLHENSISQFIYRPIGIYNLITYRKYDHTWHLINVINTEALNENLGATLQLSINTDKIFQNHSISSYIMDLRQCNLKKSESIKVDTLAYLLSLSNTEISEKDSNHSIIIPLPFRFYNHIHDQFRSGVSYANMVALPPADSTSSNDIIQKLLSAIKYRTGLSNINSKVEMKKQKHKDVMSIYDACLIIYETYGMDARIELMKLQLEQRMLVPILVSNPKTMVTPFRSYIKTLTLVEVPVLQLREHFLAQDSKLLRIGLISAIQKKTGGLSDLIEKVFRTFSIRQPIPGTGINIKSETIAEVGYGFLPDPQSPLFYQPVILTHIIGNFQPLLKFIVQYVDVLIVEYNENDSNFAKFKYDDLYKSLRTQNLMIWKHTIDADFDEVIRSNDPFPMNVYEGNTKAVTFPLQNDLLENFHLKSYLHSSILNRPCLVDIIKDVDLFHDDDILLLNTDNLFENLDTIDLKKTKFQFQHSYKKEAKYQLERDTPILQLNDARRTELDDHIRQQRIKRSNAQKYVQEIPLLKSYRDIIAEINDKNVTFINVNLNLLYQN